MEDVAFSIDYHGMPGIIAPLVAHNVVSVFGKQVNNLALAFVPPLQTYDYGIWHLYLTIASW